MLLDHSLEVHKGVSLELFGSKVARLGAAAHCERWLPPVFDKREFGCSELTELGRGSNVRGIQIAATFDSARGSFVLQTPEELKRLLWIVSSLCDCETKSAGRCFLASPSPTAG